MQNQNGKVVKIRKGRRTDGSDKKSYLLVFWLFVAKIAFILLVLLGVVWLIMSVRSSSGDDNVAVHFDKGTAAGYTDDGKSLWLGGRSGVVTYKNGTWIENKGNETGGGADYLPVEAGYYLISDQGSRLSLIRQEVVGAADPDRADEAVATSDIPDEQTSGGLWAAGYRSKALFHLVARDGEEILFLSTDGGKTWERRQLSGIDGKINDLAVDPESEDAFAVATSEGLFVTEDGGRQFRTLLKGASVNSASYSFERPSAILAATFDGETNVYRVLPNADTVLRLETPTMESDPIVAIACNPGQTAGLAVLTAKGDVYVTENRGANWTIRARDGKGL